MLSLLFRNNVWRLLRTITLWEIKSEGFLASAQRVLSLSSSSFEVYICFNEHVTKYATLWVLCLVRLITWISVDNLNQAIAPNVNKIYWYNFQRIINDWFKLSALIQVMRHDGTWYMMELPISCLATLRDNRCRLNNLSFVSGWRNRSGRFKDQRNDKFCWSSQWTWVLSVCTWPKNNRDCIFIFAAKMIQLCAIYFQQNFHLVSFPDMRWVAVVGDRWWASNPSTFREGVVYPGKSNMHRRRTISAVVLLRHASVEVARP